MTGIIKTDQLQGAQSSTITVPSGNNLTVGGALGVTGAITGTLATAAQTNITSLGTLSFVTVNGTGTSNFTSTATSPVQINGTSIPTLTVRNSTTPVELQMRATTGEGLVRTSTNHPLAFAVNASEKMRITSAGNVGIGTASPNFMLDIVGSSQNLLELSSGGSFGSAIVIDQNTNSDSISISSSGTGSPIVSNSAGASNIIAKSTNGNGGYLNYTGLTSGGSTTFSVTHNGRVYAGDGILLGGTGDANRLDDYEEGGFTPTIGGNTSYARQLGHYTKVGDLCFIHVDVIISTIGTGSVTDLSGLPFTAKDLTGASGHINMSFYQNLNTASIWVGGYVNNNTTTIFFNGNSSAQVSIGLNRFNVFQNGTRVLFSGVYKVA